ncbi:hypothetical protein HHI36_012344 [Cryptolaemus montrouzieri]|uniref:Uncharacterized protein n=1 Tax=Cryptolaemus montrouzieri TaxID=559131 RepID=A0ABD2NE66_9CUCU
MSSTSVCDKISWYYNVLVFLVRWLIRNYTIGYSDSIACLNGKTAIVTGGNAGIGYAITTLLASRGCRVIIACRSECSTEKNEIIAKTGNPNILIKKLDLASIKSVRSFAEEIKKTESKIDILVNNAGASSVREKFSEDGLNALMHTNYFGSFLLTHLLVEPLKASANARVVFTSSILSGIQQVTTGSINPREISKFWSGLINYSNSKFLNTLAGQEFAKRMRKYNINVNTADTGSVRSEIFKKANAVHPSFPMRVLSFLAFILSRDTHEGAQTSFHLATSEKLKEETGQLYFRCKPFPKASILNNQEFCDEIWRRSEELVKLKPQERL